ncbi:response regulator transcription factor [Curtobacterium pusillum]|uniref:Response regulator transcription factor n=1 Tax=Curtobacterium pusillum TaxID=69373 RepID=A0ABX2MHH2_9MICO|nr:response regulator transcription factor [Curtobacterium pusillum]NUU14794.1 response regulator transcription factor [Curtobacterium pusillum]GLK31658.1 DNA-binding response regulator [Curtobacterium pusillum]
MTLRVFLVDDHELVRQGVARVLDAQPDIEVVGEAESLARAVPRITATRPDVAVLDVRLPDGSGIDLCRTVRSARPELACLMLTAYDDDEAMRSAVLAGAIGYVLKDIRGNNLVDAVRRAATGSSLFPAEATRRIRSTIAPVDDAGLTLRETQILDLIVDGLTNRQIGERLHIAEKTVKNNVTVLLGKLHLERRTQAAVYGARRS